MNDYNTNVENWKDIDGFEGSYKISSHGRVKSLDRANSRGQMINGRVMKPQDNANGYKYVTLYKGSRDKRENHYVHRLVAKAFIKGELETVNHIDGNKSNNHIDNLEWATRSDNTQHAYNNGLMTRALRVTATKGNKKINFTNSKDASNYFGYNDNWVIDRVERHGRRFVYDGYNVIVHS